MQSKSKHSLKLDMMIAGVALAAGLAISGFAAADIMGHRIQLAQATPPLQSTPGAETRPAAPNTTGESQGVRPADVAPQPARPDPNEIKAGTPAALPPAPAEKVAPPMPAR